MAMTKRAVAYCFALIFGLAMSIAIFGLDPVDADLCSDALKTLMPCIPYLKGSQPTPVISCCDGARSLQKMASTTAIRRELCDCFEKAGPELGVLPEKAKLISQYCQLQLPVALDPSVNCSSVP